MSDVFPPVVHGGFFRLFGRSDFEAVFSLSVVSLCGCFRGSLSCFVSVHGGLLLLDGVLLFLLRWCFWRGGRSDVFGGFHGLVEEAVFSWSLIGVKIKSLLIVILRLLSAP